MNLEERALLVNLSISMWSARKTDREVTREVTDAKNARSDSGTFRKVLLGKEALKEISRVANAARLSHYALTLPWSNDGARIITTEGYEHYSKVMRDYRNSMQDAVEKFSENYDAYVKQAKQDLGKLFKSEDYPAISQVKSKFNFDVEPTNIPVAHDFRAKVSNAEAKAITKDIERRMQQRLESAMNDVWKRIADVTEKMSIKLEEYQPRQGLMAAENFFKDSLVENVKDLASVLPSLNIKNDPELTKLHADIMKNLLTYDAKELREDERARKKTAKQAKRIYDKVSKYLA